MTLAEYEGSIMTRTATNKDQASNEGHLDVCESGWCGNFRGFIQYRKMFNNENITK